MKLLGHICFSLCWLYQCEPSYMNKKLYFFCSVSTFGLLSTIYDGLKLSDTLYFDDKLISKLNITSISDLVVRLLYILNGIDWHVALARSLIVHIGRSIIPTHSSFAYTFSKPGSKDVSNVLMLNSLFPWYSVILNTLVSYFLLFPRVVLRMVLFLLMSVILPIEHLFLLSYCVVILNHLHFKNKSHV